jgi:uncharacterized membrane protein YozB (DUF420 family)
VTLAYDDLPAINATLNSASAVLLATGYICIRAGNRTAHRYCMQAAFAVSIAFLACYLLHHIHIGGSKHFTGQGSIRTVYFVLLASHTLLAATVPVLASLSLVRARRGDFAAHRAIARWALPVWFYVSVTGVVVYWMLYQMTWAS